jgi:hypothetical protein
MTPNVRMRLAPAYILGRCISRCVGIRGPDRPDAPLGSGSDLTMSANVSGVAPVGHCFRHQAADQIAPGDWRKVQKAPGCQDLEVDFVTGNPGDTLFHGHQQLVRCFARAQ